MLFSAIKTNIGINLSDTGQIHFTNSDLQTSLQDAYDDICCLSQCIIKKVNLDWQNDLTYYDFSSLSVTDYLGCIAIYNNINNRWLQDDLNLKQFDKLRTYWEIWHGTPNWWAFSDFKRIAVVPKQEIATGTFDLYYWATAPTVVDGSTPLIATDVQKLFEQYSTADLLEQVDEFSKANIWWADYYGVLETYIERTKSLARADLRLLI